MRDDDGRSDSFEWSVDLSVNAPLREPAIRLSADVGGTFTDVAAFDENTGALRLGKTLTTPQRLVTGIENGVGKAGSQFSAARMFLHGTTVAINTILERSGAKCALLTTQGFRDIYEIGRVNRPESYNLFFQKHKPLIDRDLRFEIMERIDAQGTVLIPLDEEQVRAVAAEAVTQGVRRSPSCSCTRTAIPRTNSGPRRIDRARNSRDLFVTASHELQPGIPRVRAHLDRRGQCLCRPARAAAISPRWKSISMTPASRGNFLIVQSTGGLFDVEDARQSCIRMLESGPAAGVVGTKALCDSIGITNAIAFDMGGTTAKAGRDLRGQCADDRRGADRRLCHRSAGADADDRHPGGRHRRRQHRARRGRQRVARRPGECRAHRRARSATGSAAPSRPSPTPTWCSAGSAPTASSAAR